MASSLNHPHILTVHVAGESGGRQYLVTKFVDGRTLAHDMIRHILKAIHVAGKNEILF